MKLRLTADFAELEQKVVGFTDLRILVVIERARRLRSSNRHCFAQAHRQVVGGS